MRKKGKIAITITIGIVCFILVMIMCMQFKVIYQTDITSIDTMKKTELEAELANWKTKFEEVEDKYKEVTETLAKYKEESNSDSELKESLEEELEKLKLMLGTTNVDGKGIIITFKDDGTDAKKIEAEQLMVIVNYLKDAGAEAISINDHRIVNTSDFVKIREGFNKVNGERVVSPYTIKAIGDPDYLKSALIGTGYVNTIKSKGQEISFEEKKKVEISKYEGSLDTKYVENQEQIKK